MKIKKLLKIFGLSILAGNIVNAEYIKRNGEIYYRDWSEEKTRILKNIDKKSFEILENDFAKDKNNIYYQGEKIEKIDPKSAKIFGSHFVKDEKIVFDAYEKKELKDVDTKTLKSVGDYYFKDKNNAYFDMKKIDEKVDLETFVFLDYFFWQNKIQCIGLSCHYHTCKTITFIIIQYMNTYFSTCRIAYFHRMIPFSARLFYLSNHIFISIYILHNPPHYLIKKYI